MTQELRDYFRQFYRWIRLFFTGGTASKRHALLDRIWEGLISVLSEEYEKEIKPLLQDYCYDCHGDGSSKGDLAMDDFQDLTAHLNDLGHWLPLWHYNRPVVHGPSKR